MQPFVFIQESSGQAWISRVKNLTLTALEQSWNDQVQLNSAKLIAVRGGEPTLNPEIVNILHFLKDKGSEVYLETHGEWIETNLDLLNRISNLKINIKLSLD